MPPIAATPFPPHLKVPQRTLCLRAMARLEQIKVWSPVRVAKQRGVLSVLQIWTFAYILASQNSRRPFLVVMSLSLVLHSASVSVLSFPVVAVLLSPSV